MLDTEVSKLGEEINSYEAEQCVAYVAITRAKKQLHVLYYDWGADWASDFTKTLATRGKTVGAPAFYTMLHPLLQSS